MWFIYLAFVLLNLIPRVVSAKFSLPLFKEKNEYPKLAKFLGRRGPGSQSVLNGPNHPLVDSDKVSGATGLPIQIQDGRFIYTTNISLGTPPQSFRAIVDLNWAEPFVPSSACSGEQCEKFPHASYNSSSSSTYVENGTITDINYGPVLAYGRIQTDTLSLGSSLEIPSFDFIELKYYELVYPDYELSYFDSVLGLAIGRVWPPPGDLANRLRSPFRHMIDEGILDENVVSILWPKTKDDVGDVMFGGYDEGKVEGDLVKHKLVSGNITEWQIGVEALYLKKHDTLESTKMVIGSSWPDWTGLMMSRTPMIGLPATLAQLFFKEFEWKRSDCGYEPVVDCDSINDLPGLIIGLKGQNITLTGEDYVEKVTPPPGFGCDNPKEECMVMITALPDHDDFPPDFMVFGTLFMKKVYSVFDWDEKTISFGTLKE